MEVTYRIMLEGLGELAGRVAWVSLRAGWMNSRVTLRMCGCSLRSLLTSFLEGMNSPQDWSKNQTRPWKGRRECEC